MTEPDRRAAPALSLHQELAPGLHLAFTTVAAGNLAFHVSGAPAAADGRIPTVDQLPEDQLAQQRAAVSGHRHAVEELMGVRPGSTSYLEQIHSDRVVPASAQGWGTATETEQADAQVSATGTEPLAVMVADCLPVVFVSRRTGEQDRAAGDWIGPTAVAHAGRAGLLAGVLENTVEALHRAGAGTAPGDIQAWIGPAICGRCYEVPEQMQLEATAQLPALRAQTRWGTPALDLPAGAEAILGDRGVQVHLSGQCTFENEHYYSHRREPGAGRLAGLVWRTGND